MPELPEVETVRRGLSRLLSGKVVASVTHDWPKGFPNAPADVEAFLIGAEVIEVRRRAKVLLIDLSSQYTLVVHLKMTGQLVFRGIYSPSAPSGEQSLGVVVSNGPSRTAGTMKGVAELPGQRSAAKQPVTATGLPEVAADEVRWGAGHPNDSLIGELPDRSTRVTFTFTDSSRLFFNDQRKFGWVRLMPTAEVENLDFFKKVGPEPLGADFTWHMFRERLLRRKKTNIKAALLDQTVVAGVGNIYADESLWGAKIHPTTLVGELNDQNFSELFTALRDVLALSIEKGGSTDKNYVDAEGKRGSYLQFAGVFRREGLPCPRCGTTILKTRVAGRGTHTCPVCQPEPLAYGILES